MDRVWSMGDECFAMEDIICGLSEDVQEGLVLFFKGFHRANVTLKRDILLNITIDLVCEILKEGFAGRTRIQQAGCWERVI